MFFLFHKATRKPRAYRAYSKISQANNPWDQPKHQVIGMVNQGNLNMNKTINGLKSETIKLTKGSYTTLLMVNEV